MTVSNFKKTGLLIALVAFLGSCNEKPESPETNANAETKASEIVETTEIQFDSLLAAKYGADDYGMKKYVMAFLKRGPNRDMDGKMKSDLMAAHMENIKRLANEGKLVLAGPFFGDGDLRGIYVFDVETVEEAEALTNTDPAIQAGTLVMELIPWYGSAALMEVTEISRKIAKKQF